jgi:hypothetical protein
MTGWSSIAQRLTYEALWGWDYLMEENAVRSITSIDKG